MWKVYNDLRKEGLTVWIDQTNLEPGTLSWDRAIEEAIMNAGCFVVLLSPSARRSEWVREELHYAKTLGKRIFPLLANGDAPSAIPFGFSTVQYTDIRGENYANGMQKLVESVCKHLGIESYSALHARQREQFEAIKYLKRMIDKLRQDVRASGHRRQVAKEQIERMMQEERQMQAQLDWLSIQRTKMQEDYKLLCQHENQAQEELITLSERLQSLTDALNIDQRTVFLAEDDDQTAVYEPWEIELPPLQEADPSSDETISAEWSPMDTSDTTPRLLGGYPQLPESVDQRVTAAQKRRKMHR